jgi:hypothetical protein
MMKREGTVWAIMQASISTYDRQNRRVDEVVKNPTWDQCRAFIDRLDGSQRTATSIEGPNGYVITIGVGPDRFYVSTIGEDMGPYDLLGPDPSEEPATVILGGVETNLPRRLLTTRAQALQAGEYFYHHGKPDPELNWQLC